MKDKHLEFSHRSFLLIQLHLLCWGWLLPVVIRGEDSGRHDLTAEIARAALVTLCSKSEDEILQRVLPRLKTDSTESVKLEDGKFTINNWTIDCKARKFKLFFDKPEFIEYIGVFVMQENGTWIAEIKQTKHSFGEIPEK